MLTVVEPVPEGAVVLVWVLSSSRSSSLRELSVESELDDAGGETLDEVDDELLDEDDDAPPEPPPCDP